MVQCHRDYSRHKTQKPCLTINRHAEKKRVDVILSCSRETGSVYTDAHNVYTMYDISQAIID